MATFEQSFAERGRQSELDALRARGGGAFDKAKAAFQAGGGGFSFSGSGSNLDFGQTVSRALQLQQQAVQPAVASFQASIPETQQRFAQQREQVSAEKAPLQERFKNLLADIKGQGKVREEAQTRITSGELGKRGIVGSSTLAQQEIQSAIDPIRASVQTATRDIGLEQESGLRQLQNQIANLGTGETGALRDITNAIAQLQSGAGAGAIDTALQQLGLSQQQSQFDVSQRAGQTSQQLARDIFEKIQLPGSQVDIRNIESLITERGRTGAGGAGDLLSFLGLGGASQQFNTGFSNVDSLLAQGRFDEAERLLLNP